MPRYRVYYTSVAVSHIEVEADSLGDARDVAGDKFTGPSICAQCSGWGNPPGVELSDVWEQIEDEDGVEEV